jgi:hypothetical protein
LYTANIYFQWLLFQDMTKADLYKRRNKNKQRKSSSSEPGTSQQDINDSEEIKETSLIETINNLKSRMNKSSIDDDVELIKANTQDTPINEESEPIFTEEDDIPPVKPVEKTYSKPKSKLDDYIYIESSQGLDETEVAFPKTTRGKKVKESTSPVPRKRRKVDVRTKKAVNGERELRSKESKKIVEKRVLRNKSVEKKRPTKESIENEKAVTRVTRKRKHEETNKPVLREKGQNGHSSNRSSAVEVNRKIVRPKKKTLEPLKLDLDQNVRMTRSRRRRLEISLSPSEVKEIVPAFSFESERRMNSIESNRSVRSNTKAKARKPKASKTVAVSKVKKAPVRATRSRAARR